MWYLGQLLCAHGVQDMDPEAYALSWREEVYGGALSTGHESSDTSNLSNVFSQLPDDADGSDLTEGEGPGLLQIPSGLNEIEQYEASQKQNDSLLCSQHDALLQWLQGQGPGNATDLHTIVYMLIPC